MDTMSAIASRRSIRRFDTKPVPRKLVEQILQAGIEAPSAKNRQPWRFVVVTETQEKVAMLDAMRAGLQMMTQSTAKDNLDALLLTGAWNTLRIMEQAPVTIFILNIDGKSPFENLASGRERMLELANAQSLGACIQNMCLEATELGLGSLWICDVYLAYQALTEWLGTEHQLFAALSVGYPTESPARRPRNALHDITTWH